MARLKLSQGFKKLEEGTYVFFVEQVEYKPDFGAITMKLVTETGQVHVERYNLLRQDGTENAGAMNAFSYLARAIVNDPTVESIDETELVGKFFKADVVHNVATQVEEGKEPRVFVNLTNSEPATGWGEPAEEESVVEDELDVDALLG